jgi:hypothetical protein
MAKIEYKHLAEKKATSRDSVTIEKMKGVYAGDILSLMRVQFPSSAPMG